MKVLNAHKVGRDAPDTLYIGRPSPYGNPFKRGNHGDREDNVLAYRKWIRGQKELVAQAARESVGKNLLCYCAPKMCHGHVLRDEILNLSRTPGEPALRYYDPSESGIFHKTADRFGSFSNMKKMPLVVNETEISSSEALYQALRFPQDPEFQAEILAQSNGFLAKRHAYTKIQQTRPDWENVKVSIMRFTLQIKYATHRSEIDTLFDQTSGQHIIEKSSRDMFWGAVEDDMGLLSGQNALGRLWMDIRYQCKSDPGYCLEAVRAPDMEGLSLLGLELDEVKIEPAPVKNDPQMSFLPKFDT